MNTGIYCIEHVSSGKKYVGSASNFNKRFYEHERLLRKSTHPSSHLQNAWNKYGAGAFKFRKLLVCSEKDLLMYEQKCIDGYDACKAGYNLAPVAGRVSGVKWSEESRARLSAARKGCKTSDETKAKLSAIGKGRPNLYMLGRKQSVESSEKKRAAMLALNRVSPTRGMRFGPNTQAKKRATRIKNGSFKLSPEKAADIRARVAAGERRDKLAAEYGVYISTVGGIIRREIWN